MASGRRRIMAATTASRRSMMTEVTPEMRRNNAIMAVALFGIVGGIYYTAISKLSQRDELQKIIEREELANESDAKKK
jgi:hypothetical protein